LSATRAAKTESLEEKLMRKLEKFEEQLAALSIKPKESLPIAIPAPEKKKLGQPPQPILKCKCLHR
jgi:hypothetical protein